MHKSGIVILALLAAGPAFANGLMTHDEIAQLSVREIDRMNYPELFHLLREHPDERDAGSVFPDWGYAIQNDELSLIAHSGEFREAYEAYVRENFPPPYESREKRQAAFLEGLVGHQASDNLWHPYFLEEAMSRDGASHNLTELGVDIFTVWEQGQMDHTDEWYVPLRTIVHVYDTVGESQVTGAMVILGMQIIRAGMYAEQQAGFFTYLFFVARLPWTHEHYMTYAPGGILDDALASAEENQITWDNIHGEAWTVHPPSRVARGRRSYILEMGRKLLESGKVFVPVEHLEDGSVIIGAPEAAGNPGGKALRPNINIR